jgi:hypothetical protein
VEVQRLGEGLNLRELEEAVAQLRDQVWWMALPFWRRWLYMAFGHRKPIAHFYRERGWWAEFVRLDLGR